MAGETGWSKNGSGKSRRSSSRAWIPPRFSRCRNIHRAGFSEKRPGRVLPTITEMRFIACSSPPGMRHVFANPIGSSRTGLRPLGPGGQAPTGANKVAGVSVRVAFQIVLMFRFCHPEFARWFDSGDDFPGPQSRGVEIRYRLLHDLPLLIAGIENRRTIAGSDIVPLAIPGRGIVDLEEEL